MAKLDRYLGPVAARRPAIPHTRRALALMLTVLLVFAGAGPAWARTVEVESEGEGSAAPGALPGLEASPELEGEETALGEAPALAGEESGEEAGAPVEVGAPEAGAVPPVEEPQPEVLAVPDAPPAVEAPSPAAAPVYEAEAGPTYQAEPAPPALVHGETIVAPPAPPTQVGHDAPKAAGSGAQPAPSQEAPIPVELPEQVASPPAATPSEPARPGGSLAGHDLHVVAAGESLWSIATALLPAGSGNAEIASEVRRLWKLNESRIGTGDPNLILVGTVLRLH